MGHSHALNLSGVFHSLGKAEWSVWNWSPVGLKEPTIYGFMVHRKPHF